MDHFLERFFGETPLPFREEPFFSGGANFCIFEKNEIRESNEIIPNATNLRNHENIWFWINIRAVLIW